MARTVLPPAPRSELALGEGWVEPHWLSRLTVRPVGAAANEVQRRWTVLGGIDSPQRARVDLRGLVCVDGEPWSLDWWVGAEDRWHVPAREASVRQGVLGSTPVVETRVRIPGGDAVQRAFAARDGSGRDALVIEIENASKVPFAVGLSLRPYDLDGLGGLHAVAADDRSLLANGRVAALLPNVPRHTVASRGDDGDAAEVVFSGAAGGVPPAGAQCPQGLATLAVLHPLAHGATLRVVLPLGPEQPDAGGLPDLASVVSGWQAHRRSGGRVELPDRRLQAAFDTSVAHLLARPDHEGAARALDRVGFHGHAAPSPRGTADGLPSDPAEAACRLVQLTEHWSARRDPALAAELAPVLAALVAVLGAGSRRGRRRRRRRSVALGEALAVTHLGGVEAAAARRSAIARLGLAAEVLDAAGEHRAAGDVRATQAAAEASLPPAPSPVGDEPSVEEAGIADAAGNLAAAATLRRALSELRLSEPTAVRARLAWTLGTASGAWSWPSAFPSGDTIGGLGDGHDVSANAELVLLVREMLVADLAHGLALSPLVPDAWLGQGWELHDVPTTHGLLSFAVRWHGDRPALLWDLERTSDEAQVTLSAPALDPSWSSIEARGEALLAPVAVPEGRPSGVSMPVTFDPTRRGSP